MGCSASKARQRTLRQTTRTRGIGPRPEAELTAPVPAGRTDPRRPALRSPSPPVRPARLGARLKPRLHSPTPPRQSTKAAMSPEVGTLSNSRSSSRCRSPSEAMGCSASKPLQRTLRHPNGTRGIGPAGRWAGGQAYSHTVSERVTAPRAVWPEGQRKSPSTAQPGMPQAAQRLAAAPARPAASRVRASGLPRGRGPGRGPTGTGL